MPTYNPSTSTVTQKPIGISKAQPTDARTYYYDNINFIYRPFASTTEVLAYFTDSTVRRGHTAIIVNTGGTIDGQTGYINGGVNREYWWKDNYSDSGLVVKSTDITQSQMDAWSATKTLNQVLLSDNSSDLPIKVSSVFVKDAAKINMSELSTAATTTTRKVLLPDASGTLPISVAGVVADPVTGDIPLSFYTQSQTYTKSEVDALVGTGSGGTAGVASFKGRTGAVAPAAGDYTKLMVGLGNVDDTSDATKNAATVTLTNKTLVTPKISSIVNGGATLTLPSVSGTVALTDDIPSTETGTSIRSKLGITTLSGSNTGDQDLSGYVLKVTGKSLIADTEITRLGTLQNVQLTQGSNITITGVYPDLTISSTASGGATNITVPAGTNSVVINAGTLIRTFVFLGSSDTVSVGYTPGGTDILDNVDFTTKATEDYTEYFESTKTIYFTKGANTTAILF